MKRRSLRSRDLHWSFSGEKSRPRRASCGQLTLERLEIRLTPSSVVPINSGSPVPVPLGSVKAGSTVSLKVTFTTTDNFSPDDRTEGEPVVIQGPGYYNAIYAYGTQTIRVPVTQDNEKLSAYIKSWDGDESGSIETAGTVTVEEVSTKDSKSLTVRYLVQGNDSNTSFPVDVYRSSASQPGQGDQASVADVTVKGKDAGDGEHSIIISPSGSGGQYSFSVPQALRPDPTHGYVVATADQTGTLDQADANDPPSASLRIYVMAIIAHGYSRDLPAAQARNSGFAQSMQANGYDRAYAFNWTSTTLPNTEPAQAQALANSAGAWAQALATGKDDVVDVNFIGYSRGGIVVSLALQDLVGTTVRPLAEGFQMETLIDPHPANNVISQYSAHVFSKLAFFVSPAAELARVKLTSYVVGKYQAFQASAQDPSAMIPSNVQASVEFYQNTLASTFSYFNSESILNLWGQSPGAIPNQSSTPMLQRNVTAPGVGHAEIMEQVYSGIITSGQTLKALGLTPFSGDPLAVTTQPPSTLAAGTPFGLIVKAENADGTVNTSYNGPVTLAIGTAGSVATLGGTVTVTATKGVATFTNLTINRAGTVVLTATASGIPAVTTNAIAVTPAPVLAVSPPAGSVNVDGSVFVGRTFSLTVQVQDANGNAVSYSGPVTLALGNNPGGAALAGPLTATASFGYASFSGLTLSKPGVGFTLVASAPGAVAGTSAPFSVFKDQLVMTTPPPNSATNPPGSVVAGSPFGFVVMAEDASGTVDASFNGDVSVTLSDFSGGANSGLKGALTVRAVNGVATFSGLSMTRVGANGNFEMEVTSPGLADAFSLFTVVPAPPSQLVVTVQPARATAGGNFSVAVSVEDPNGNVATSYSGSVTIALGTNPGGSLHGTLTAQAFRGVATFSGLSIGGASGSYTLQATASGLTTATSAAIGLTQAGVATRLVLTAPPPGSVVAGATFGLTVKAEDENGTVDTNYTGPVTIGVASISAGLKGTLTVQSVKGVATFSGLTMQQAGSHTLSVGDGLVGTTAAVNVTPAAATQLVVVGPKGSFAAGGPFGLEVDAVDAFGNVNTSFNGSVTVGLIAGGNSSLLGGTLTARASAGVALFDLSVNAAGSGYVIQATSGALKAGNSAPFGVALDRLVVMSQPPAIVGTGGSIGLVVEAVDALGNLDTSFNGTLTVAEDFASTSATLGGALAVKAVGGIATFQGLTLNHAGTFSLAVTGAGLTAVTTNVFSVTTAPTRLVLTTAPPRLVTVGSGFGLVVAAEDATGGIDGSFTGPVTVTLAGGTGGATLGGSLTVDAVAGVATFSGLYLGAVGGGYTLRASGDGLAVTTAGIDARARGVATRLVVATTPVGAVAGRPFGLVVDAVDDFGALDPTFSGPVTVALAEGTVAGLGGTATVHAVGGVATFSGLSIYPAGSYALTASGGGLGQGTSSVVDVSPSKATQLEVIGSGGDVLTGSPFGLTVAAVDAGGQVDPSFAGNVTLSLPGPSARGLGGTLTMAAAGGVATFSGLTFVAAGDALTVQATAGGLTPGRSPTFDVFNDQMVVTGQPQTGVTAGTGFGLTVAVENAAGQVDTSYNGIVMVSPFSYAGANSALGGGTAVDAVHGIARFSGLTLDRAGDNLLSVTGNGAVGTTTNPIVVNGKAADHLAVMGLPSAVTVGSGFGLVVSAEDAAGDADPTFNGPVTVTLAGGPGGALGGTATVQAVAGVATFSGLSLGAVGDSYTLRASGDGLAVTTAGIDARARGVATRLVVATAPAGAVAGRPFGLVVDAVDDFGALDPTFAGPVTAALPGGTLGGTATVHAVGGIASFSNLSITQAADGDTLSLSSHGLNSTTTGQFSVVAATATRLSIQGPESNVLAGEPFGFYVDALDAYGNVDSTFTGPVTLTLAGGTGGATLAGTATVSAINGVASFLGLSIGTLGGGYTLRASADGLASDTSSPFGVTKGQLVVTSQPPGIVKSGIGFGLSVAAEDAAGNVDATFHGAVTLSMLNLGAGNPQLGGPLTVQAVNGVATFSNVTANQAGTFALSATAVGEGLGVSNPVDAITATAASATPVVGVTPVVAAPTYGQALTFTAVVKAGAAGGPTPTGTVQFEVDGKPLGSAVALVNGAATSPSIATLGAGAHSILAIYSGDAVFAAITSPVLATTVAKAPLVVIANSATKIVGRANPPLFVAYLGFVLGQDSTSLAGTSTITTTATATSPAGSYPITPGGLTSPNYAIAFVPGSLTVSTAVSTVAIISNLAKPTYGQTLVFGAAVAVYPGAVVPTGAFQFYLDGAAFGAPVRLVNGAALSPSIATLGAGAHYVAAIYSGDATYSMIGSPVLTTNVGKAPLTIVADSSIRVYGQPNPLLTATYSGFVNGETPASLMSPVELGTWANPYSPSGSYLIVAGGASSSNYAITFVDGSLGVIPPPTGATPLVLEWTAEVTTLYEEILGRVPDAAGFDFWVRTLGRGTPLSVVALDFWDSPEHLALMARNLAPRTALAAALGDAQTSGQIAYTLSSAAPSGPMALLRQP